MSSIINYLIGFGALTFMTYKLKIKSNETPNIKIGGIDIKSLINLSYIGIACFAMLILVTLLNL